MDTRLLPEPKLDPSVVICAYTEGRWDQIGRAVASSLEQVPPPREVILVIDHNPALLERAIAAFPAAIVIPNDRRQGLSGARNTGVSAASGSVIAFLDDDAAAEPGWLAGLLAPFADPDVVATGGRVEPAWQTHRPPWMPPEFDWVVGCSFRGQATTGVRNPIGASMAFRRSVFEVAGGFRSEVGRIGMTPVGCEETELCLRALSRWPNSRVVLEPASLVRHQVPAGRGTLRYFVSRCFAEGQSKAIVAALAGSRTGLATERSYMVRALPRGVISGLAAVLRGDAWGLGRAAAIPLGLAFTGFGYVTGRIDLARARRPGLEVEPELIPAPTA